MNEKTVRPPHPRQQQPCTLEIYPHGTITHRRRLQCATPVKHDRPTALRGEIETFSKQSAARLRRYLAQLEGPKHWACFGATLTVPGPPIGIDQWRRLWNAFRQRLIRFGNIALIWRIEMQLRGQPHMHLVCWAEDGPLVIRDQWLDVLGLLGPYDGPADIMSTGQAISADEEIVIYSPGHVTTTHRKMWPGASEHAVKISGLGAGHRTGLYRYVASHTSKSKQAQLGWKGRQWGFVNKSLLAPGDPILIECITTGMDKVIRGLQKVTGCPYASTHGRQTWFADESTAVRLGDWVNGIYEPTQLAGTFPPPRLPKKKHGVGKKRRKTYRAG